jgi:sulfatase maturation enzyme AslB (radical SAM superfamily)
MTKPVLPFVETMITYGCNLSCLGCTNYSDYDTRGWVPWAQGREWLTSWVDRVDIPDFGIMGGEPLMNPQVNEWIRGTRDLLPTSQIRFTTNGVLLHKKPEVLNTLLDIGNCVIKLSVHQPNEFYTQQAVKTLFGLTTWEPIEEYGIKRWLGPNQVRLQINFPQQFVKSYRGNFSEMLPHSSDPAESFAKCVQQTCPLLYNGRIYKCSSIALLDQVLTDWNRKDEISWQPYLNYQGIGTECSADELENFIGSFGMPESICAMCPSVKDVDSIVDHPATTVSKLQWIKQHVTNS